MTVALSGRPKEQRESEREGGREGNRKRREPAYFLKRISSGIDSVDRCSATSIPFYRPAQPSVQPIAPNNRCRISRDPVDSLGMEFLASAFIEKIERKKRDARFVRSVQLRVIGPRL